MKTFIVEVTDESKTEFVETLLSQLDGIAFKEKAKMRSAKKKSSKKKLQKGKSKKSKTVEELFANTIGIWKDRDIDAKELRKKAWGIK